MSHVRRCVFHDIPGRKKVYEKNTTAQQETKMCMNIYIYIPSIQMYIDIRSTFILSIENQNRQTLVDSSTPPV